MILAWSGAWLGAGPVWLRLLPDWELIGVAAAGEHEERAAA
jgi:hypothetical protein